MSPQIYLDFNATAPTRPEVIDAMADAMRAGGNASSVHATGRAARSLVEEARRRVAALVNARPDNVIFTGSGTEADNQVLRCVGRDKLIISAVEHEAVMLARGDAIVTPVKPNGVIDLDAFETQLAGGDAVVSVMTANNETGILQPIAEIARLAHKHGALVHSDAIQAAGKIPVDIAAMDADFLSLSAHKIGGPQGIGAVVCRDRSLLSRFVHGGSQENGLRAGTENVAGIAGFGVAAASALAGLDQFAALGVLRDTLERRMADIVPGLTVFGGDQDRLPNTSKVATPGLSSETQVMGLDLAGIAISAGSACAAGRVEAPYVLTAMGVPEELAICAVRVSLGWTTTADDMDKFLEAWRALYERAQRRSATAAE
ncbi:MAG: cysteine desulfurase family protein [Proteobacteria bacterium]|nr:cysteine desulfurase family protein [Pseudomonadota bacterium]